MRLGAITLQNRSWDELLDSWRYLDGLGLDSLWIADHLANPMHTTPVVRRLDVPARPRRRH